jgi:cytoskeletal protein RodZ
MSDENSFAAVATQAPTVEAPIEEAKGRNSKALLIVGLVAVVVLAVFAYLLFFKSSGSDAADTGVVPSAANHEPAKDATKNNDKAKSDTKKNDKSQTKSADVEGRDPFKPLQVAAPTTDTGTDTTTGDGTTTGDTGATASVTVGLTAVNKSSVNATVDGKAYKGVGEGETFATNFQVYAIFNDSCAGFLYGDESFVLCEGKSVSLTSLG